MYVCVRMCTRDRHRMVQNNHFRAFLSMRNFLYWQVLFRWVKETQQNNQS